MTDPKSPAKTSAEDADLQRRREFLLLLSGAPAAALAAGMAGCSQSPTEPDPLPSSSSGTSSSSGVPAVSGPACVRIEADSLSFVPYFGRSSHTARR